MQQVGWSLQIPESELYYQVLRKHHVMVHPRRGVKILGLWYHGDVLDQTASGSRRAAGAGTRATDRAGTGPATEPGPWDEPARTVAQAVDADRRRRREATIGTQAARPSQGCWTTMLPAALSPANRDLTTEANYAEQNPHHQQ